MINLDSKIATTVFNKQWAILFEDENLWTRFKDILKWPGYTWRSEDDPSFHVHVCPLQLPVNTSAEAASKYASMLIRRFIRNVIHH